MIGAGHSGLAMSARLSERGIDHVVLERGEVANSWRSERWDSLRLLTPNWLVTLPGSAVAAEDPDGYLTVPELIDFVAGYARAIDAPVETRTTVTSVSATDEGYAIETDRGAWSARAVVLAGGAHNLPVVPEHAAGLPASIAQVTAQEYRNPAQLPGGGVLVVGASATGVQLADELARSGRRVVLSVGEHVRMPRGYRGRDVFWWLDAVGVLDERYDELDDVVRARHTPSPQLVGAPDGRRIDLATLQSAGVEIVGRLGGVRDGTALFSGGLSNTLRLADLKQQRLLDRFDEWADLAGIDGLLPPQRPAPVRIGDDPLLQLDLARQGIRSVLWATGYRPDYRWLRLPVLDHKGSVRHDGGVVTGAPGLYLLGTAVLRRRRSTYISGAAADTADLAEHLVGHLALA